MSPLILDANKKKINISVDPKVDANNLAEIFYLVRAIVGRY
jgi:hypothetical protein